MRASDIFQQPTSPVQKYRTSINPPYKKRDYLTLGISLFLLLALPITVLVALQARDVRKSAQGPTESAAPKVQEIEFVSNEILIKVKKEADNKIKSKPKPKDTGIASLNNLNKSQKATKFQKSFKTHKKTKNRNHEVFRWYKITLPGKKEIIKEGVGGKRVTKLNLILEKYKNNPNVEEVQLNLIAHTTSLPNDTYVDPDPNDDVWSTGAWGQTYEDMWGLKRIQADQAWDFAGNTNLGEGVIIAVVDTGLDYNHEDIANNVWINTGEDLNSNGVVDGTDTCPTPNGDFNCVDDDGNGFIDDLRGWDFADNDNNPIDRDGHGSHVSGTAAAEGNNGKGIAGVAPKAQVMALKGFPDSGSAEFEWLGAGIIYAADNGAKVINNSWGCYFCPEDLMMEDAVSYAYDLDIVLIFAAGNDFGVDIEYRSPQNMRETMVVSGSDQNDNIINASDRGFGIDVSAPGAGISPEPPVLSSDKNILSLKANGTNCGTNAQVGTDYCRFRGTSMAAPHVAGLVALIREKHPAFTNEQIRQVIRVSADDISDPGFDINSGYGRINVLAALAVDNPLNVNISTPSRLTNFNGSNNINIEGTASGTGFESYSLSYGVGLTPSTFTPISGPHATSVTNGTLGTWDVSSVTDSQYYIIKLSATDGQKSYVSHVVIINELANLVSTQTLEQRLPDVSEDRVVWEAKQDFASLPDIYLYNFNTGKQTQLTDDPTSDPGNVSISGDKVVWDDDKDGVRNVYLHDIFQNTTNPIIDDGSGLARIDPDIDGSKVAWKEGGDIYAYDLDTATKTQLTSDPSSNQSKPKISGNRIVWEDRRSGNNDIWLYDFDNPGEVQITSFGSYENNPDIFGDKIVYDRNGDIYMYDIPSGDTTRVNNPSCPFSCNAGGPKIFDNRIVWTDRRGLVPGISAPSADIWLYDIDQGVETLITPNLNWQQDVAISATKVVWVDLQTDPRQIFFTDISGNNAPVIKLLDPDLNNDGSVTVGDIGAVVACFGTSETQPDDFIPPWVPACDLNVDGSVTIGDIGLVVGNFGTANWPTFNSIDDPLSAFTSKQMQFFLRVTDPDGAPQPSLNISVRDITDPGNPVIVDFNTDLGGTFTTSMGPIFTRGELLWVVPTDAGKTYEFTFTADDGTDTTEMILYIEVI